MPFLACCGKLPELVFGQWEPHAPDVDCRVVNYGAHRFEVQHAGRKHSVHDTHAAAKAAADTLPWGA